MKTHLVLMFLYAAATGAFFSLLWREERRERIRMFLLIFCSLFLGAIAVGWAMYAWAR